MQNVLNQLRVVMQKDTEKLVEHFKGGQTVLNLHEFQQYVCELVGEADING